MYKYRLSQEIQTLVLSRVETVPDGEAMVSGDPWPLETQNTSKADAGLLVWTCCVPCLFSHLVILSPAHTAGPARTLQFLAVS